MSGYLDWLKGVRDSDLDPTAKLTAYTLATFMDFRYGECWPSRATIAHCIRAHPSTVTRAVRRLERAGLIETKRRRNDSNVYRRKFPDEPSWYDSPEVDEPF